MDSFNEYQKFLALTCWLGLLTCKTVSRITYTVYHGGDVKPCSIQFNSVSTKVHGIELCIYEVVSCSGVAKTRR